MWCIGWLKKISFSVKQWHSLSKWCKILDDSFPLNKTLLDFLYYTWIFICECYCTEWNVCKLELCVLSLSPAAAAHSSLTTEVRQPPSPSIAVSLPVSLSLSSSHSPLSPLYLSHSSLWSMPGACAVGAAVCLNVCLWVHDWDYAHVIVCSVCATRRWRVFVCVHTRLAVLWSSMQCLSLNWRAVYDRGWC